MPIGTSTAWSSTACSTPPPWVGSCSPPPPGSMPTPSPGFRRRCAGGCCACSRAVACCRATTRRRWGNGNTAAGSPSTARCASRLLTVPDASGCCVIAPGHLSPWTGCANSTASACSMRAPSPVQAGGGSLLLTPLELIERIAALVTPPRIHRRYFGVLARTAAHWKLPRRPRTAGDSRQPGSPWPRIAAVGERDSCRKGQLTGAVANSHQRP